MNVGQKVDVLKKALLKAETDEQRVWAVQQLNRLPVTLDILLQTGIGKLVNSLRYDATVGKDAKALVHKWKDVAIISALARGMHVRASKATGTTGAGSTSDHKVAKESPPTDANKKSSTKSHSTVHCSQQWSSGSNVTSRKTSHTVDVGKDTLTMADSSFEDALGRVDRIAPTVLRESKKSKADSAKPSIAQKDAILQSLNRCLQASENREHCSTEPAASSHQSRGSHTPVGTSSSDYLQDVLTKKRNRAQIYAGKKTKILAKTPSLFDICIRVICANINGLGYTGGVPMDILEPILLKATPAQLHSIETYNPYLLEDTDVIWKNHCAKEFAGVEPDAEAGEGWRDLYERKMEERDKKLRNLAATISAGQAMQAPTRTTRLAEAKTPREVLRKQIKHGTCIGSADALLRSERRWDRDQLVIASLDEGGLRSRSDRVVVKPPKAPLMQKTLKMMKQYNKSGRRY